MVIETPLSSGPKAKARELFNMDSGPVSENDVAWPGEVQPAKATSAPEVGLPFILEL